jgi:hypothetical protein
MDNFFMSNITPLFYIETLADLEKEVKAGKTPEWVVSSAKPTGNDRTAREVVFGKLPALPGLEPKSFKIPGPIVKSASGDRG